MAQAMTTGLKQGKILRLGLKRVKGYMYYIKEGAVWAVQRGGGKKMRVERFDASIIPPGSLCYIDKDGDLACAPRRSGGGRKVKAKRAAGVRRLLTPAGAQAAIRAAQAYIKTGGRAAQPRRGISAASATASLAAAKAHIAASAQSRSTPRQRRADAIRAVDHDQSDAGRLARLIRDTNKLTR